MSNKKIEQWEVEKYWTLFAPLSNGGTHLTGAQAAPILKNSNLRDDQLERVWDIADIDNDGNLDFEEFCVAMRLIFDLVNGEYADVPATLPSFLIPSSKSHLIDASSALAGHSSIPSPPSSPSDSPGLKDGFSWYMPPASKQQYESIYTAHASTHGSLTFPSLDPLFASLSPEVPDTDIRSAWNLVNPAQEAAIGKDAALAFLHILNQRHDGYRIPRTIPASLRASFETRPIDYNLERQQTTNKKKPAEEDTASSRRGKFGDTYLSRLGLGGGSNLPSSSSPALQGTDFSTAQLPRDWEEVRLKRQLQDLESKIARVESSSGSASSRRKRREEEAKPALVKRELGLLLDYKRKEVRELEEGGGGGGGGGGRGEGGKKGDGLRGVEAEIQSVRELIEGLEQHWKRREGVLEGLRREVDEVRGGR